MSVKAVEPIAVDTENSSEDEEYTPSESSSTSSSSTVSSAVSSSTATTETDSTDSETESEEEEEQEQDAPKNEKITLKKTKGAKGRWKLLNDKNSFRKEWEDMYDWVQEHPSDPKLAVCNKCFCIIKAQKAILDAHQKSKKHMRNTGELIEETPPKRDELKTDSTGRSFNFGSYAAGLGIGPDGIPYQMDDQINFFTESAADAAHQAVTSLIDKLVEKYHQNRLANLKVQNAAVLQLERERTLALRKANTRQLEQKLQREAYARDFEETSLKLLQIRHEALISAMEKEKDAKLKAVEQELVFAKQEYEKKVKLLDSQLSSMK